MNDIARASEFILNVRVSAIFFSSLFLGFQKN
jgi:hypothetical protein